MNQDTWDLFCCIQPCTSILVCGSTAFTSKLYCHWLRGLHLSQNTWMRQGPDTYDQTLNPQTSNIPLSKQAMSPVSINEKANNPISHSHSELWVVSHEYQWTSQSANIPRLQWAMGCLLWVFRGNCSGKNSLIITGLHSAMLLQTTTTTM